MNGQPDQLQRLAQLAGVATSYRDAFGRTILTSEEGLRAVLAGIGLEADTPALLSESLARLEAIRTALVSPVVVFEADVTARLAIKDPPSDSLLWRLRAEDGSVREGHAEIRFTDWETAVELPASPAGYYDLEIESGWKKATACAIVAPPRCLQPQLPGKSGRGFGFNAQVYGLRSTTNFGIGDFSDVASLAERSSKLGSSFLGLSPVHAMFSSDRTKISPYSPSSRLFIDPIFIDPRRVPGFDASGAAALLAEPEIVNRLTALRDEPFVDHPGAWALKHEVLDLLWAHFSAAPVAGFETFRRTAGPALELHAIFESLGARFRKEGRHWLGEWPHEFQSVTSPAIARYRSEMPADIAFQAWLQWLADLQFADAQARARSSGMHIGLYRDLAVGADSNGSEVWARPERFAKSLSVGAPPDPLGPRGQDWGLPPFDPLELERQGLAGFRDLVTANMRHAGAVRIDHAFQLQRLFLIPRGGTAAAGAYVDYPFAAMLAVLRLESQRNGAIVIAEDLGNAPEGFSDAIMRSGILSYRILPFEREDDGRFKAPDQYPREAFAAMTTHDLPTFAGWWHGLDIDLRETFAIYDAGAAAMERGSRRREIEQFCNALAAQELLTPGEDPTDPPFEAGLRYLARTHSIVAGIQIEDIIGELNQANLPGHELGHPNWKRRLALDLDRILEPSGPMAKAAAIMASEGRRGARASRLSSPPPRATYRLQFHEGFTFDDALRIIPYLADLGVSHVYASPVQKARPGSTHGYDNVDPNEINPELGGAAGFGRLCAAIESHGLQLLLDIVPNHMGVGGSDNKWWLSLLEWGEKSPYADTFDVDWERLGANHKLVAPFLGGHYGEVLEKGELKLAFDADEGSFSVWHYEHRFPLCSLTYSDVLDRAMAADVDTDGSGVGRLLRISEELRAMAQDPSKDNARTVAACESIKARMAVVARRADIRDAIGHAVKLFNGIPGRPERFGALHRLLERQSYRLAYWRVAASDVNYRRFFDIDTLAGIRIENPAVFDRAHAMIFRLVREGSVRGLRVDHIDGLADPAAYARALQHAIGPGFYIVAEKILEPGEDLRPWPLAGTTGYDALNLVDGVFVDAGAEAAFDSLYRTFTGFTGTYESALMQAKMDVLQTSFSSELESLVSDLKRIADADRVTRDYTANAIRHALSDIVTAFPVYRTYIVDDDVVEADRALVRTVIAQAKKATALPDRSVHDFAGAALLGDLPADGPGRASPLVIARFRRRLQQLTGPVMAKSLEDTLFYRYVRFLALNEVGGEPSRFGVSPQAFHEANVQRAAQWPHAMIATSTHDTKRGEDARARLLALSEMPDGWAAALATWQKVAALPAHDPAPDATDQYMLLQALLGAWPLELLEADDEAGLTTFRERMKVYFTKALREAKRRTRWIEPDASYEDAAHALIDRLLTPGSAFLGAFRPLVRDLSQRGLLNGLGRSILKATLPGVPDLYQGTELWDFSLVDPDNRRPVDYAARAHILADGRPIESLFVQWQDGAIKQRVLARLLADRAARPAFYAEAGYAPLDAAGARACT